MLRHHVCSLVLAGAVLPLSSPAQAGPITAEEARRQEQVLEQLKKGIGDEATDPGKFKHIARAMKGERDPNLRRRILEIASALRGPELDKFLTDVLTSDADAGLRSLAATILGRTGSEKCLGTLAQAAAKDRTTQMSIGDVGGESSARRAATFAIARLAARFPRLTDDAVARLRALPVVDNPRDNEGLFDARLQALYQITRDKALLEPFYERLKSADPKVRMRGVVAFRLLELKRAPTEIIDALKDPSSEVRSWAALVLGEIGDLKVAQALMKVAGDTKEDIGVRCNAIGSLGHMKAPGAGSLMEKLLADTHPRVRTNAAVTLYRITGKKVKEFPRGYRTE
jgi:HEAT repeat protein